MILRRFMQHVKEQNWFAVGLDVIVVIVGIFLGLQVQAWYENRNDRELELFYINQLHEEILRAEPYAIGVFERLDQMNNALEQVIAPYRENGQLEEITNVQCNSILRSHVLTNFIAPITTIDELEQTGRSLVIQNNEIRRLVMDYKSAKNNADRQISLMKYDAVQLSSKYPEVVTQRASGDGFNIMSVTGNTCEVELAGRYPGFRNDLVTNINRTNAYANLLKNQFEALQTLRSALDVELKIKH